ncbi:adenylosuccinate lyase [Candidatus Woesearchaeota archaeon]|jgi:adenylosuccinate lyase|nr:adenylosuccinate lyase [Candidatus Woesearchaeota archaeon]MBT4388028.1 adenylosuccinate lyase [Candidatus Woesearchaeota archaeon]MBT4596293.1 adenylosuccinate lyase [Candidatus Woesearchaeota archaeon]MBT5740795.1 adenylosuccinate lyase [Candidatus Woesearchaeota archaeon]MBT6505571.1 adenylosuccinate lyase [Candidatus Woesearchaeota archaeon]
MVNNNILSQRYVTDSINDIFSEEGKTLMERRIWLTVLKSQFELGLGGITKEIINKYESNLNVIDLKRIGEIETITKHDVKAKIQAFNESAQISGNEEQIHRGMTSRDLTDNVEQYQILCASKIIMGKKTSLLNKLLDLADKYEKTYIVARTHHQPAQLTTFGKRISFIAEELLYHIKKFDFFIEQYPLRGIKGPVGTQVDMLNLLGSDKKVYDLEKMVAHELGFEQVLDSVGQIYPRSLDFDLVSNLVGLSSASENFTNTIRLMAGYNLLTEGFKPGQVGSAAMPHKQNTRTSERVDGFSNTLKGYLTMASIQSGNQWEEGDVSCSVARRVFIADAFYAIDGQLESTLNIVNNLGIFPEVIKNEISDWLPFLASTLFLTYLTETGFGREEAHLLIKEISVQEALYVRDGKKNNLINSLAENSKIKGAGIKLFDLYSLINLKDDMIGTTYSQIERVREKSMPMIKKYGSDYNSRDIL